MAPRRVRWRKPHVIDFVLLFIVLGFGVSVSVLTRKVYSVGQFGPLLFALSRIKLTKLSTFGSRAARWGQVLTFNISLRSLRVVRASCASRVRRILCATAA